MRPAFPARPFRWRWVHGVFESTCPCGTVVLGNEPFAGIYDAALRLITDAISRDGGRLYAYDPSYFDIWCGRREHPISVDEALSLIDVTQRYAAKRALLDERTPIAVYRITM